MAPALASPEPSFLDRLAQRLPPDADIADSYRLALGIAAATGAGLFLPMGFEYAASRRFDAARASPADMEAVRRDRPADLSADVAAAIRLTAALPPAKGAAADHQSRRPGDRVAAIRHAAADQPGYRAAGVAGFLARTAARSRALSAVGDPGTPLRPGEVRILRCRRTEAIPGGGLALTHPWAEATRIAVEAVEPGGAFPAKTVVGQDFTVSADIFGEGHDVLAADLLWQPVDDRDWRRVPMRKRDNDRWEARVLPDRIGLHRFAVEGWWDQWGSFTHDLRAKVAAGQDVTLEIQRGSAIGPGRAGAWQSGDDRGSDAVRRVEGGDDRGGPAAVRRSQRCPYRPC